MAVDNLSIQKQINVLLEERSKILSEHTDLFRDQVALAGTLKEALSGADPSELADRFTEIKMSLIEASKHARNFGKTSEEEFRRGAKGILSVKTVLGGFLGVLKSIGKSVASVGAAIVTWIADTAVKSVKYLWNVGKGLVGVLTQAAASAWNIGKAIASFSLRVFQGLLDLSDELAQKWYTIFQVFENQIRAPFGSFAEDVSKNIRLALRNMGTFAKDVGFFGMNLYSVFRDVGEAASWLAEQFRAFGAVGSLLGDQIAEMGMDFIVFQKGMGLSGEQMRALGERAIVAGKSLREVLTRVANMSLQLSKAFGYSGKLISQSIGEMVKDVTHFGNLSAKRLGEVAVRARSLGLEVESLAKVIDKFLTFDDAAESAAKLSQAFGINVDAITLMREASQGGMGAIDELRRAFFEAGQDAEKMSLVQLRLLAQNTGLSESEARLAFSMRNRGKSMEEISRMAESADKKELSQAEVMSKLADATERFIRFIEMKGGLFDRFVQGFSTGTLYNHKFLKSMLNLRSVSEAVWHAGFRLGRVFMSSFKPLSQLLDGLDQLYDKKSYQKLMKGVTRDFEEFFKSMSDPKKSGKSFDNLLGSLGKRFKDFWSDDKTKKFREGLITTLQRLGETLSGVIPSLAKKFALLLKNLGKIIRGEVSIGEILGIKEKVEGVDDFLSRGVGGFIRPIVQALKDLWKEGDLQDAFADFLNSIANFIDKQAQSDGSMTSKIGKAFGNLIKAAFRWAFNKVIKPALSWLVGFILDELKEILKKKLSAIRERVLQVWSTLKDVIKKVKDEIKEIFTLKNLAHGLGFAVGLILRLFLTLPQKVKNAWTMISDNVSNTTDNLERRFSDFVSRVESKWEKLEERIITIWNTVRAFLRDPKGSLEEIWRSINHGVNRVFTSVKNFVINLGPELEKAWDKVKEKISLGWDELKKKLDPKKLKKIFVSFIEGIEEGLGEEMKDFPLVKKILDGMRAIANLLEIKSPSRWAEREIGRNLGSGITRGVETSLRGFTDTLLDQLNLSSTTDAVAKMKKSIVADSQAINRALDGFPDIDLTAKMSPKGSGLGIDGNTLRVETGPLNLNLNLTVTMEAGQLATVLVNKTNVLGRDRL